MARLPLSSGPLSVQIDPEVGGRVTGLSHGGREFLCGPEVHPSNWGATFWTSPQRDWGWPPVEAIDTGAYELVEHGESRVALRSSLVELGERRFFVEKHFVARAGDAIDVTYVIDNVGATEFSMACWEISRVAPGGLSFFPTGEVELTRVAPHGELNPKKEAGFSWFDHRAFRPGQSLKLHADASAGLLAHRVGEHLLLKCFEGSPAELQAPGEGEVELFAEEAGRYVELEVQGPFAAIAPGAQQSFSIRTHVARCSLAPSDFAGLARLAMELRERVGAPG